jgi:hypothetical protein
MMMAVRILAFLIDDDNAAKFAAHGISRRQVAQVLDENPIIVTNRKNRRATHIVIGRDWGGQCIAIPVEPTDNPVVWRPVTAWRCKGSEEQSLRRRR